MVERVWSRGMFDKRCINDLIRKLYNLTESRLGTNFGRLHKGSVIPVLGLRMFRETLDGDGSGKSERPRSRTVQIGTLRSESSQSRVGTRQRSLFGKNWCDSFRQSWWVEDGYVNG